MKPADSIGAQLRVARDRLGLSLEQAGELVGVTPAALSVMEMDDDEIGCFCTPNVVRRLTGVLRTSSRELFNIPDQVVPLSLTALEQLIREHCQSRGIFVQDFQQRFDWTTCTILEDLPLVLVADICKELTVDWRRVYAGFDEPVTEPRA